MPPFEATMSLARVRVRNGNDCKVALKTNWNACDLQTIINRFASQFVFFLALELGGCTKCKY